MCWTEITWNAPHNRWNVERPTGPDYRCDIFKDEVQTAGQVGPIDRQPTPTPRTPAPSTEDKREESEDFKGTVESGVPGNTTEEEGLANLAESIHINPPVMATMTEPAEIITEGSTYLRQEITGGINPHVMIRMLRVMGLVPPPYVITSNRFRLFPLFPPLTLLPCSGLICDNTPLDLFQLCLVVSRFVMTTL